MLNDFQDVDDIEVFEEEETTETISNPYMDLVIDLLPIAPKSLYVRLAEFLPDLDATNIVETAQAINKEIKTALTNTYLNKYNEHVFISTLEHEYNLLFPQYAFSWSLFYRVFMHINNNNDGYSFVKPLQNIEKES